VHHASSIVASLLTGLAVAGPAVADPPQEEPAWKQTDPRYGLLSPLPETGGVPPIVQLMHGPGPAEIERRKLEREYEKQIRRIAYEHLGKIRVPETRARGIAAICELDDPVAFMPMIEVLAGEADDVRLAMVDHFAACGKEGQAALAWVAIHDKDPGLRAEARSRLGEPAPAPVLRVLDGALRSPRHEIASRAGLVAGAVNALETIPLLIFAQAAPGGSDEPMGDLAWIAIEKQRAFIAALIPIVGDGVAAFQPIPGVVSEGVILRVYDAVVVIYRTEIHRVLVGMTSRDWGQPTGHLGYDMDRWWAWYNDEYLPFKNEQIRAAALAATAREAGNPAPDGSVAPGDDTKSEPPEDN
jgi:hypothetical protein